eukprot:scaffold25_cov342-Pavlova_lutheri.AAC.51
MPRKATHPAVNLSHLRTCGGGVQGTPCSSWKLPNDLPSTCLIGSLRLACPDAQQTSVGSKYLHFSSLRAWRQAKPAYGSTSPPTASSKTAATAESLSKSDCATCDPTQAMMDVPSSTA